MPRFLTREVAATVDPLWVPPLRFTFVRAQHQHPVRLHERRGDERNHRVRSSPNRRLPCVAAFGEA